MRTLLCLLILSSSNLWATTTVQCKYLLQGYPFADVTFTRNDDGTLSAYADIFANGRTHQETLSTEPLQDGEYAHGWLSKNSRENSVELVVFTQRQARGQSKMTNPHIPLGKDIWGDCTFN